MLQKENLEEYNRLLKNKEIRNFLILILIEKELWLNWKKEKRQQEDKKYLIFKNITRLPKTIKMPMRKWLMKLCSRRLRDSSKCGMHSGKERTKPESICLRMSIRAEKRTYCWNKLRNRNQNGKRIMKNNKLKLLLPNRMLSLKLEPPRKQLLERLTNWTCWSRWTRKIGFKEHSCKRKCTRKGLLSLQSWSIKEKSISTNNRMQLCLANGKRASNTDQFVGKTFI